MNYKMNLVRTTSDNKDFEKLTNLFDEYLVDIDGDEKDFFAQFNQIYIKNVVVCYENDIAVGCGAFKEYEPNVAEIKRMFVKPEYRGKGVAKTILSELENWAKEEKYSVSILETGFMQKDAIHLYKKVGYEVTENFGQYIGVENSICMKKAL